MGKKKLQGADGMNFQLQLTIKGLESINLPSPKREHRLTIC